MSKQFGITGVFHNEGFFVSLKLKTILAENEEMADRYAKDLNFGKVFYRIGSSFLFREHENGVSIILDKDVEYCQVLEPREDYEHELLMGSPIYEDADYKKIPFSLLLKETLKECTNSKKSVVYFEDIAYGVIPV